MRPRARFTIVVTTVATAILTVAGCGGDRSVSPPAAMPGDGVQTAEPEVSSTTAGAFKIALQVPEALTAAVRRVEYIITSADMVTIRGDLTIDDDLVARGSIRIPVGNERLITLNAYDGDGFMTFSGSSLAEVDPGTTVQVRVVMRQTTGHVDIEGSFETGGDDGSGDEPDDGSGDEPDDGSGDEPDDGSGDEPDDGSGDEPDDGSGDEPDDGSVGVPGVILTGAITFVSNDDGRGEIYVLNAEGGANLTQDTAFDWAPAWSPDGSQVAFASNREAGFDVFVMDASGAGVVRLTDDPADDGIDGIAWSPDGTRLAFVSNRGGDNDIYLVDADGSGVPTNLTADRANDRFPAWSADGERLLFESNRLGDFDIYSVAVDGTDLVNLTDDLATDRQPAWSPDGTQIAFTSDRSGNFEIHVMAADGTDVRRVTDDPASDQAPTWSPDGIAIAFETDRDGDAEIYTVNSDGSEPTNVTDNPGADDWDPDWSR